MIAESIAARLGNDGDRFACVETGQSLAYMSSFIGARHEVRPDGSTRYIYRDGTAITVRIVDGEHWWDLGYESCWCWDSEGHRPGCEAGADE